MINQVIAYAAYAAYGAVIAVHNALSQLVGTSESAFKSNLGYSGEQWDSSLRMQNQPARAYDPRTGRFVGLDQFAGNMQDPQSLHKYAYVHGDPIGGIDPIGKSLLSVSVSIGIVSASIALGYNLAKGIAYGFEGEYSPLNIAKRVGISFAVGFTFTYAIGWWAALAIAGGATEAVVLAAVAFMTIPGITILTLKNLSNAYESGDAIDQYFAKLDVLLLLAGDAKGAHSKLPLFKAQQRIRAFRVEGTPNMRVYIDEAGTVVILEPNKAFYLTFGDRARAEQYLAQKLGPGQKLGPLPNGRIKSFEVTKQFVDELRAQAVMEAELHADPSMKGRPLIGDPEQSNDSFGLSPEPIQHLEREIIQGTGIDEIL